jgi:O-antigen/teichoic acid export membrane protein
MVWQVAAAVIGIWALPLDPMLVTLGRPGDSLKVRLVVAGALLAGLPFMIGRFGITGAGAALVAAMAALAAGMLFMLRRQSGSATPTAQQEMACAEGPLRAKGGE